MVKQRIKKQLVINFRQEINLNRTKISDLYKCLEISIYRNESSKC